MGGVGSEQVNLHNLVSLPEAGADGDLAKEMLVGGAGRKGRDEGGPSSLPGNQGPSP